MHEYDLIAEWYARDRKGPTGIPEVQALIASLPRGASVLDVGCGNGIPLTKLLVDAGLDVVAVDSSPRMLETFRVNCPNVPAICDPVQTCDLGGRTFEAAICWGMIFHLPIEEQAKALAKMASALEPGGRFLFTSGDLDGREPIEGTMDGVTFRYWTLTPEGYRDLLAEHGLRLLTVHQDAGGNTYYLAEKKS